MQPVIGKARIAILAPISHPAPPPGYGPWEQVAYNIADGLRRRGVDVTLFCAANSSFAGKRRSVVPVSLADDPQLDGGVFGELHIASLFAAAREFDLIHNNLDWRPLCHALGSDGPPMVTTVHGFSSPQIFAAYYAAAQRSFYCSISDADRDPGLPYLATVYNGIDLAEFDFCAQPDDYLLFFGRIHEEKGTHLAIDVARRARRRLLIAGIIHDQTYFRERVETHIDGERVRFLGEVRGPERSALLGRAAALLQLNTRPERFGLSMIEAMACGTPVIGTHAGSIPEVVADGVTGFVCGGVDEAAGAVGALGSIDRAACRSRVQRLFTTDVMVDAYVAAYAIALERRIPSLPTAAQLAARERDWWSHPVSFTDIPPRPATIDEAARLVASSFSKRAG